MFVCLKVLFDHNGCIRKFSKVEEILREFFEVRMEFYEKRKRYLEGMLTAESSKLDNIARFILEKIEGKIVIGKNFLCVCCFVALHSGEG
jgi:DNA topoisomerase-2